jgi:hypothetical protein
MTINEARERFVECGDLMGIDFADKYLGGYQHWKMIEASSALAPYIAEWREELEVRIRSAELKRIGGMAEKGHYQASKLLLDRGWSTQKAGRPTKEAVERETRVQAKMKDEWKADVVRIKRD